MAFPLRAVWDEARGRFGRLALPTAILVVALFIELALVAVHGLNKVLFGDGTLLALDSEANFGTWFSTSQLLVTAVVWLVAGPGERQHRGIWLAMPALFAALSMEEITQVHERSEELHFDFTRYFLMPAVAFAAVALFLAVRRVLRPQERRLVTIGAAVLLISQASNSFNAGVDFPNPIEAFLVIFQDWSEMVMATFMLAAPSERARDALVCWARHRDGQARHQPPTSR